MVIGLGVRPSVCFSQILKSSDEIRSGNGVLALGTKEFRNLVLLHSEVEIGRSIGSTTWSGGHVYVALACCIACAVVIGMYVDVGIVEVVVLRGQVDIIGSSVSRRHRGFVEALILFKKILFSFSFYSPQIVCFDLAGVIGFVMVPGAVFLKALIDVLFLSAFCCSGSVCSLRVFNLLADSAFLCC